MLSKSEEKKIASIIRSLRVFALGDIKKSMKQPMVIGSFLLCACFIDLLCQNRYWGTITIGRNQWDEFIKKYFDLKYRRKGKRLYKDLRCTIVHNYSLNKYFSVGKGSPKNHLKKINNRVYLHLRTFVKDIENAYNKYESDLLNNNHLKRIAISHYNDRQILRFRQQGKMMAARKK